MVLIYNYRAYSRESGHPCDITKKKKMACKSSNGKNYEFLPIIFLDLGNLERTLFPKRDVILKVLTENKVNYSSKMTLLSVKISPEL